MITVTAGVLAERTVYGSARRARTAADRAASRWIIIGRAVLCLALVGCGGAPLPSTTPIAEIETFPPPPAVAPAALTLGPLTLRSVEAAASTPTREERPPMLAEMLDDTGRLTGTRCGATSLSADGVLRRDDTIVASLVSTESGILVRDGAGNDTQLVLRDHGIESPSGELRFRRDGPTIVSPDSEVPSVEITPMTANRDTALALFATLLVCNDLGP